MILRDILVRPQRPDGVLGLNKTSNFSKALDKLAAEGIELANTPFDGQGDRPLLFPFLILEAKRNNPKITFEHIQNQTGLPIRSLLKLQDDLFNQRGRDEESPEPLVWFVATRGLDICLYGCYIEMPSLKFVRSTPLLFFCSSD